MSTTSVMPARPRERLGATAGRDGPIATAAAGRATDDRRVTRNHQARPRRHGERTIAGAVIVAVLTIMLLVPGYGLAREPDGPHEMGLLWLPDPAAPPVPTALVIALYDTTGIDSRGWRYAEQITAAGIAVLHVDLQDTAAEDGGPAVAADDPAAALVRLRMVFDTLAEDPRFAAPPLGLIAFGAAGQAATLAAADPGFGNQIAALVLLYPGCAALDATMTTEGRGPRSPILLLHGDADPANSPADCLGLAAHLGRTAPIRRVQYAGAGYAWDLTPSGQYEVVSLPWPGRPGQRLAVSYWPQGAALSATQAASWFAAAFAARLR